MKRLNITAILFLVFLFLLSGIAAGCGKYKSENTGYALFYLNKQREKIVSKPYDPESTDTDALIKEYICLLYTSITECYSIAYPADQQGEIFHRYILGVYNLYERLTSAFPEVLFESCASGGRCV